MENLNVRRVVSTELATKLKNWILEFNGLDVDEDTILRTPHYVFLQGSKIAGSCALGRSNSFSSELHHLWVRPEFRRQGVGLFIVRWALGKCEKPFIAATVRGDNTASKMLFDRLGFRPSVYFEGQGGCEVAVLVRRSDVNEQCS